MKERATVILTARIPKALNERLLVRTAALGKSKNAWLIWAIEQGLRCHKRDRPVNITDTKEPLQGETTKEEKR